MVQVQVISTPDYLYLIGEDDTGLDRLPEGVFFVNKDHYDKIKKITDVLAPDDYRSKEMLANYLSDGIHFLEFDQAITILESLGY